VIGDFVGPFALRADLEGGSVSNGFSHKALR
jgi:hypothetical protein